MDVALRRAQAVATARTARIESRLLCEGDVISLDAEFGRVYADTAAVIEERPADALEEIAAWRAALPEPAGGG